MATASNRVPVSLRIPSVLSDAVEAYAVKNHLRKTDAYVHFLQRGIDSQAEASSSRQLSVIQEQLAEVMNLLKGAPSAIDDARLVRAAIAEAAADYPAIDKAYLFGSFARGGATPESDIDIRLDIDRGVGFSLHDLSHFMKRIEQETGRECDVITAANIKNASLARAIEREKELVYERSA